MLAVGIDLVEVAQIEHSITKNPRFLTRFFGTDEQLLFERKKGASRIQTIAAGFAAKEAFSKALGTGIVGFALNEIQLLRADSGAPILVLSGRAQALAQGHEIAVSVSHTDTYATAVVILT